MLCGAPRARKSTLNAYLTVCALTSTPAFGILPVTPIQRAAIFYGEGVVEAEATRFYAAFAGLGIDAAPYKERITIFGPQFGLRFDPGLELRSLRRELQADGYDFVSFDPLVNFHSQEENTSKMATVMAQITAFTEFAGLIAPPRCEALFGRPAQVDLAPTTRSQLDCRLHRRQHDLGALWQF
jgi:hypothetical protein